MVVAMVPMLHECVFFKLIRELTWNSGIAGGVTYGVAKNATMMMSSGPLVVRGGRVQSVQFSL